MDVLELIVPQIRALAINRVFRQQRAVMLQMRAAAGGVADDGVKLVRRELIDALAGQLARQPQFAVVRVEGPAAMLPRRA